MSEVFLLVPYYLIGHWCGALLLLLHLLLGGAPAVLLALQDPLVRQLLELLAEGVQGKLPVDLVVSCAHVDCPVVLLLLSDN